MRRMGLTLLAGPANAGKVETLLERYLAVLERDPVLIVPNRSDVERVERDLLRRSAALLGGSIGTFDDVFERIARGGEAGRPVITETQRWLVLRRTVAGQPLDGLAASARFGGFADALGAAVRELEGALVEPAQVSAGLAGLFAAYRAELDRLGVWDRDLERAHAAERIASELPAWDGTPVFAYGFEDLTAAQWRLLEALAGRAEVTVSLPYEPARPAFSSLERTATDLAALASGQIEELPPRYAEYAHPALAHLERELFADGAAADPPPLEGAVHWLEGAGARGALELVGEEILQLLRDGTTPESILIVAPALERVRAPLETAFTTLGIPFSVDGRVRLGQTGFGHALLSLLRFDWANGGRRELYAFLRAPYSGLARAHVDFLEGRLRGRAIRSERVEEETLRLRGAPLAPLDTLRAPSTPLDAIRAVSQLMLRAAYGLDAPPTTESARLDLRAYDSVMRVVTELEGGEELVGAISREEALAALERSTVRVPGTGERGRVSVVDLLRARTGRFEIVFVLGLEEGSLPRRGQVSPFLDDEERRRLDDASDARLVRPDSVGRDRYLFYAACTRATRRLVLVREAATDDGSPREPSPFWDEARALFSPDDVTRWTKRRPLSALTWPLERAPTERERLRAVALLAAGDDTVAREIARANGWDRRIERALAAFTRLTPLRHPAVLEELRSRATFNVTELEAFADCSSIWFLERVISPRSIDAEADAKLRGGVAHQALYRFFTGLPKRLGVDRPEPDRLDDALTFLRECLEEALAGVTMDLTELQRLELEGGLWRDLEAFVRAEAEAESPFVPRRFELSFGSERSAQELQRGLDLGTFSLSGKIDRIDVDPFSARGIVHDYKSGKTAHSAAKIEQELRLQIPLYMLVLRDLVGIEPLGGVYRALAGKREARGLLRAEAREDGVPEFHRNDYLDEDAFWAQVEGAQERARAVVERIRGGDVAHDPRFGDCPDWCSLWSMCRVRRA
jgi:ATP-dependent helicase/DNAse subunit B